MAITAILLDSSKEKPKLDLSLSVSKAKTFDDCKAKYKFCYIQKLPRIDRDFHIFGKFLHSTLESFHKTIIQNPEQKDQWKEVLSSSFSLAIDEYKEKITKDQIKEGQSIVNTYKEILEEEGLPNVRAVEQGFLININDKILLNGFIDRVQVDPDGMIHVADYKTTKDAKYLKDFFQLKTYCYALMLQDESIKRIRSSFILLRHDFKYITEEFKREDIFPVAEKFVKYAKSIEEEKAWRPNPQFLCKYCDYLDSCKSGYEYLAKKGIVEKKAPIIKVGACDW